MRMIYHLTLFNLQKISGGLLNKTRPTYLQIINESL